MKPQEGTRRSIDDLRDGAGSLDLSTPDDNSEISEMITVAGRLLVVKGKGIYEVKLADQVDPKRTNIGVPNTIQRVLPFGSEHPWVGAVVSTAHNLLKRTYLPNEIDCDKALALVLDIAQDISGMYELTEKYRETQEAAIGNLDPKIRKDRSILVPAVGNVAVRCKEFLQKSDHALRGLFDVVKLFYMGIGSGGWESLKKEVESGSQDIDNFPQFLSNALPLLHLVRNARNCVEHPRQDQRMEVNDFSVDAGNNLLPPMIEIIHPKTPLARVPVADFIAQVTQSIVEIVELMVVFLCTRHAQAISAFPVQVVEIPPARRTSEHVRFGYGLVQGDEIIPMS
jgi:hypothetical protein